MKPSGSEPREWRYKAVVTTGVQQKCLYKKKNIRPENLTRSFGAITYGKKSVLKLLMRLMHPVTQTCTSSYIDAVAEDDDAGWQTV